MGLDKVFAGFEWRDPGRIDVSLANLTRCQMASTVPLLATGTLKTAKDLNKTHLL